MGAPIWSTHSGCFPVPRRASFSTAGSDQPGFALAQVGGGGAGAVGFCHKPSPRASPQPPAQLLRHACASELQLCMINFGTQSFVFIENHELTKQFSLEIKNLISWGVFLQRLRIMARCSAAPLQHCSVLFKKSMRKIYEHPEISGQTSVNFRQSSIRAKGLLWHD